MCPNHRDENFDIYYLDEKMRSQDEEFSKICDLVRLGNCDNIVIDYMKQHIKDCPNENNNEKYAEGKLSIIVTTNAERERINTEKLDKLLPGEQTFKVYSHDEATNIRNAPPLSNELPLTKTGQLQREIVFKKGAPVMITSNHSEQKYKNNGIVNGARGFIDSIQSSKDDPEVAEIIWVKFNDPKIGQLLRNDSISLLDDHTPNDPLAVPIKRQKKQFKIKGNVNWMREQFPLTLCYAITAHKSQGQTLDEVIIDFSAKKSYIMNGSFYTALSRVKFGHNFFLRDFKEEYIKANENVAKKMTAMKLSSPYQFKKVYLRDQVFRDNEDELKIGYININCLFNNRSIEFINNDKNLLELDTLVIAETWLTKSENTDEELTNSLSNWKIVKRFDSNDGKRHMGMLLLQSCNSRKGDIICESRIKQREGYNRCGPNSQDK